MGPLGYRWGSTRTGLSLCAGSPLPCPHHLQDLWTKRAPPPGTTPGFSKAGVGTESGTTNSAKWQGGGEEQRERRNRPGHGFDVEPMKLLKL